MNALKFLLLTFLFIAIYLIPTFVAIKHSKNKFGISLLNLVLGWTFLGWIASLMWALVEIAPNKNNN